MKNTPRKNNYFPSPAGCANPPSGQSDATRNFDEGRFTRYLLARRCLLIHKPDLLAPNLTSPDLTSS